MRALALASLLVFGRGEPIDLVVAPHDRPRRHALAEWVVPAGTLEPPIRLREGDRNVPCQWERGEGGLTVRWLIPDLPAGEGRRYALEGGESDLSEGIVIETGDPASIVATVRGAEVARFRIGGQSPKPCVQLSLADGRPLTRGFPLDPREGESRDHPHHEALFVGHGDVNGRDYWSVLPIQGRAGASVLGPVFAELGMRLRWGEDLVERRQVKVLDAGEDLVMDWTITLTAEKGPVVLGKTKEGMFAIRVAEGLTENAGGAIVNSDGRRGEEACRAAPAAWCDFSGEADGKKVGAAILNHPESFRFPTDWHVRGYGLLSANPFLVRESHRLENGESITLRYRVYGHRGDALEGRVAEVYEAYAHPPRVHRP